jgi:hypothetical protein
MTTQSTERRTLRRGAMWLHCNSPLQPGIDRLAFRCQHAEDAFVDPPQRLAPHEAFERLDAQREFPKRQRPFGAQPTPTQSRKVFRKSEGDRQAVMFAGKLDERPAGLGLDIHGVNDGQLA